MRCQRVYSQSSSEAPIDSKGNFSVEGLLGKYICMVLQGDRVLYTHVVNSRETSTLEIDLNSKQIQWLKPKSSCRGKAPLKKREL